MNYTTPEQKGIRSEAISEYIKILEDTRLATHDIIIARGNEILYEAYWAPFTPEFKHRQYSVSKSLVSLAVGFAEQDGLLDLDDKIVKYFPEESKNQKDPNMLNQTIRHMLMMSTAKVPKRWFPARTDDRVRFYFENDDPVSRPSGTIFKYDSPGSFVVGAAVERVTGKPFMEYLGDKMFDKIGVSRENYCLKCPGGHSWGDSAVLCTPRDMLKIARFTMNMGKWNGEQILNEAYLKDATSKLIDNSHCNEREFDKHGYGYLIWRTHDNSFFFNGMGCQFAICVPDKDIIFIYNGDNQGKMYAKKVIIDNFYDLIVRPAADMPLPENKAAHDALLETTKNLKLLTAIGEPHSEWEEKVSGKTYVMDENPMGIKELTLTFHGNGGVLRYVNEQGEKELPFGMCENAFAKFPQDGYSDQVGSQKGGRRYDCAASAAWSHPNKLCLKVQVIDTYFGNLYMNFGFKDDVIGVYMEKTAEDFFEEYEGFAGGKQK